MPEKSSLINPEAILMLLVAGILDLTGLMLFALSWLGVDDYGILDVIGLFIIGGWMFTRKGTITVTKGAQKTLKRIGVRLGLATLVELIPFVGGIAPSWIVAVYFELKNG